MAAFVSTGTLVVPTRVGPQRVSWGDDQRRGAVPRGSPV